MAFENKGGPDYILESTAMKAMVGGATKPGGGVGGGRPETSGYNQAASLGWPLWFRTKGSLDRTGLDRVPPTSRLSLIVPKNEEINKKMLRHKVVN